MKTTLKISLVLIIITASISCTSVQVASNRAPEVNQLEGKIFILLETGQLYPYLAASLEEKILEQFSEVGMSPKVLRLSGLELDDSKVENEISNFSPQYVMSIQVTEGTVRTSSSYSSGAVWTTNTVTEVYDVQITDSAEDKVIWRAKLKASAGSFWYNGSLMAENLVNKIIATLREDGLIEQPAT